MPEPRPLNGLKILLVEDEFFVALELKSMLHDLGAEVVGPVGRLNSARDLAASEPLQGAVLDVKLDGDTSFPLAEELLERGVPVIFTTGFDAAALPVKFRDAPRLAKPVNGDLLRRLALEQFRR
ncbi:MAG TPA: response regulator [Alphaproteobacteria bacterium]